MLLKLDNWPSVCLNNEAGYVGHVNSSRKHYGDQSNSGFSKKLLNTKIDHTILEHEARFIKNSSHQVVPFGLMVLRDFKKWVISL